MSDYITHTSLCEDAFRLILATDDLCEPFRAAVTEHQAFAYLGASTNGGDRFVHKLLHQYREAWRDGERGVLLTVKLAFCLAWVCHRATDRQMKPIYGEAARLPEEKKLCKIYHDGFIFSEHYVYADSSSIPPAALQPEAESIPVAGKLRMPELQSFSWSLVKRILMKAYATTPNPNSRDWWNHMYRCQKNDQRLHIYEKSAWDPDPDHLRRFIFESRFYDRKDPVVLLAKQLREGKSVAAAEIAMILERGSDCHYGQALILTMQYVHSANTFFTTDMSVEELAVKLNIGKPGRDGTNV